MKEQKAGELRSRVYTQRPTYENQKDRADMRRAENRLRPQPEMPARAPEILNTVRNIAAQVETVKKYLEGGDKNE